MFLLLYSSAGSVSAASLIDWLEYGNASRFRKEILGQAHRDRLIEFDRASDSVELSPTGIKYVEASMPLHEFLPG